MKRILLLLIALLSINALQAQWRELHTGVTENLYDVCCVDTNTVFVCGQNGVILKTENGGDSWQELYRQEGRELCKIAFFDQNVGYVGGNDGGNNGVLMRTTDGGETWEDVNNTIVFKNDYQSFVDNFHTYHPDNEKYDNLFSCYSNLCVFSSDTVFIYQQFTLFRSVDGGENFTQQTFTEGKINGVFIEGDEGVLVLYNKENQKVKIKTTSDAGVTWQEKTEFGLAGGGFILDDYECEHDKDVVVNFVNKYRIKIVGSYSIAETLDGFETMEFTSLNNFFEIGNTSFKGPFDMQFSSENNGCYIFNNEPDKRHKNAKYNPYIYSGAYITHDGGISWINQEEMWRNYHYYYSVAAVDSIFYVTTENGTVYHYSPHNGIQSVEEQSIEIEIYPNPFHNNFIISGSNIKSIDIYATTGQLVKEVNTDNNSTNIVIDELPSGVYLAKLKLKDGKKVIKKIVKQ